MYGFDALAMAISLRCTATLEINGEVKGDKEGSKKGRKIRFEGSVGF